MSRLIATLVSAAILIAAGSFIRANLRGGHRPAPVAASSASPFKRCMAEAQRSYGHGPLPDSIRHEFALDCEARVGR